MSLKSFATIISAEWQDLGKGERVARVKKLVEKSPRNKQFIQEHFPKEYAEAFPTSVNGTGGLSV